MSRLVGSTDQLPRSFEERGRHDARVDRRAGSRDRYARCLTSFMRGDISAPGWQRYRATYEAECVRSTTRLQDDADRAAAAPCMATYFAHIADRNMTVTTVVSGAYVETVIKGGARALLIDSVVRPSAATDPEHQHCQVVADVRHGEYGNVVR